MDQGAWLIRRQAHGEGVAESYLGGRWEAVGDIPAQCLHSEIFGGINRSNDDESRTFRCCQLKVKDKRFDDEREVDASIIPPRRGNSTRQPTLSCCCGTCMPSRYTRGDLFN